MKDTVNSPPPSPALTDDLVKRLKALVILDEAGSNNSLGRDAAAAIEALEGSLACVIEWAKAELAAVHTEYQTALQASEQARTRAEQERDEFKSEAQLRGAECNALQARAAIAKAEGKDELADFIRDQLCCPRIHGCELGGNEHCPAERVRAALQAAETRATLAEAERDATQARLAEVVGALKEMVEEKADYMRLNKLGDPEAQHTIRFARQALSALNGKGKGGE